MNLIWCQNIAMKYEKYYIAFEENDSYHVMKYDVLYSKKHWNIPPHPWYMSLFSTMTPPVTAAIAGSDGKVRRVGVRYINPYGTPAEFEGPIQNVVVLLEME